LAAVQAVPGTAVIGLNLTNAGTLTKEGFPQFRFYPTLKTVTFGVQRFHKPEERGSLLSLAGQALSFITHNPAWEPTILYRPIYDITPDDALTAALLEPESRKVILLSGTKLSALVGELSEWVADRYTFVKQPRPRLLNGILNEYPYPFKDIPGKTRPESCWLYLADQESYFQDRIEMMQPVERVFPNLKFDPIFYNESSVLILVESDKYGADDLIAQMYFQTNPKTVRVILVKKVMGSNKHYVTIVNSNLYDNNMEAFPYPNVRELNTQERRLDNDPSWRNLKVQTIGPKKGTALSFEIIWDSVKLGNDLQH
jgi:hypothetical protein